MVKLLVSGCSFTAHIPNNDRIEKRWYHYVGESLQATSIKNLAKQGAGNEYIFTSLYDEIKIEKPDIVIAAWSKSERRDYELRGQSLNDRKDLRGDQNYWIKRSNRYKDMMQLVCDHYGITYYSYQMIELFPKDRDNVQAKTIGFLEKANHHFISDADRHPSGLGHRKIGRYIYEDIRRSLRSA